MKSLMASKHVLVIDDDPDIRDLVQMSLENVEGWLVTLAASGEEGVNVARETRPDVILLDVRMPGMDGPATFQALRGDLPTRHIPVVLLTANPQADERYRIELQLSGIIAKPFNPYALPERLAGILGW
jgi:CheY-like chemotaxis protein